MEKFVEYIEEEVKRLYETFPRHPMIELTDALQREHKAAEKCHICLKEFNDPKNKKVRDHCHHTSLYGGAAHNNCNLKYRIPDYIPIVFHNLSGCDAHLFIKELGRKFNKNDIGFIAENKEKYTSFYIKMNVKLAGVRNKDGTEVCNKYKGNMELINISGGYIASLRCERCRTKKTKSLDERLLKKNLNHTSRFWGCDENF